MVASGLADADNIGRPRSTVAEVMNATAIDARNSSASHNRTRLTIDAISQT